MTVVIILAVLLVALLVVVPLLERSNFKMSDGQMNKWARWILPLAIVLALVQLFRHLLS
ncbi:hypothetical protein [Paraglaciecola hydrolytica]|uniref:hypothetical protein n=1 Tax=Paraglaciecola hydrolytica TaxID=1799789 RepID=UPI000B33AE87|nr:hypothetical protein [Paraglaciecola hydrolytica]